MMNNDNIIEFLDEVKTIISVFLLGHIILCTAFFINRMSMMGYIEIISSLCYSYCLTKVKIYSKDSVDRGSELPANARIDLINVTIITCLELMTHMGIATVLCGLDYNFHHYVYFIVIIIMFEYYLDGNKNRFVTLIGGVTLIFVVSQSIVKITGSFYQPNNNLCEMIFNVINPLATLGLIGYFVIVVVKITISFEKSLLFSATHDKLTGLPNRRLLDELEYVENSSYVAMLDIDFFKKINDTYGHDVGDVTLKSLSRIIKRYCSSNKNLRALRWGGEEFVFIYTNQTVTLDDFIELLIRFKNEVSNDNISTTSKGDFNYRITIGVSSHTDGNDLDCLLKVADKRLYEGKKTGRNRIVFSSEGVIKYETS